MKLPLRKSNYSASKLPRLKGQKKNRYILINKEKFSAKKL